VVVSRSERGVRRAARPIQGFTVLKRKLFRRFFRIGLNKRGSNISNVRQPMNNMTRILYMIYQPIRTSTYTSHSQPLHPPSSKVGRGLLDLERPSPTQRIFSISPLASSHCSRPFRPNSTMLLANPAIILRRSCSLTFWYRSNSLRICSEAIFTSFSRACSEISN
jgi:hypothetical protein